MSRTKLNYQKALTELQHIVSQLEEDEVSIDELSEKINRAAELVKFCQSKLREAEKKVNDLFKDKNQ